MGKKIEVRLTSTEFVFSPGLFGWAVAKYRTDRAKIAKVIGDTFNLKPEIAHGLLSGKIMTHIKGDAVVFRAEPGSYLQPPQPNRPKGLVETLTQEELEDAIKQIQEILWMDPDGAWNPDREFDSETIEYVAKVLIDLNLCPAKR